MQMTTKTKLNEKGKHVDTFTREASDRNNDCDAHAQLRLACKNGTHDTHETKTKMKRNRSPAYGGGRPERSNSREPPVDHAVID